MALFWASSANPLAFPKSRQVRVLEPTDRLVVPLPTDSKGFRDSSCVR